MTTGGNPRLLYCIPLVEQLCCMVKTIGFNYHMANKVTVSVPATSANLGPGFDCLGLALELRNTVTFTYSESGIEVEINGEGSDSLPLDGSNLVIDSALQMLTRAGQPLRDFKISMQNRIPIASGLGSSAAAVIAGITGANALIGSPFNATDIVELAAEIEGHPDNVAPAYFGDLVLTIAEGKRLIIEHIPMPEMRVIVVMPDFKLTTEQARAALPEMIPIRDAVFNLARASLLVRALTTRDFEQLVFAVQDRIHQPYRLGLIPGMEEAFEVAKASGAAAVALSGAGPSLIAFAAQDHEQISEAIMNTFRDHGLACRSWILPIDQRGTLVSSE